MPGADCYCPLLPECGGFAPPPSGLEFCHSADRQPEMSACKASWLVRPNGAEARHRPECPPRGILVCRFRFVGPVGSRAQQFRAQSDKASPRCSRAAASECRCNRRLSKYLEDPDRPKASWVQSSPWRQRRFCPTPRAASVLELRVAMSLRLTSPWKQIHASGQTSSQSPLSQVAINQLFRKFDAFEFSQLGILFLPAVERQADLPRPRKNSTVIDGRFVTDVIGVGQRITLHDVNVLCHEITGSVEPTLAVQSGYIHNQGVTFPVTIRCSHPRIDSSLAPLSHIDHTVGCRIFVSDCNVVLRLNDLKRVRHVGGARHTGHVAFHFGIQFHPVRKVLLLFRCRFRFIWNLTALDDALASGDRADRTELVKRASLSTVVPDVPICGSQSLPETSEIWFAIRHSWYSRSLGLS